LACLPLSRNSGPCSTVGSRNSSLPLITGGGFHARHHADKERNFGFYTKAWDRLFSTGN